LLHIRAEASAALQASKVVFCQIEAGTVCQGG